MRGATGVGAGTTSELEQGGPRSSRDHAGVEGPRGLLPTLGEALPLLIATALLMLGNGLTGTLIGIRAGLEGFGPAVTGVVLSAYYAGFIAGSALSPSTIWRVGHIRAFAGLASLASAAVLIHVVRPDPITWALLRAVSGLCLSGLFVVIETWLNGASSNATRGRLLSAYMVVLTAGIGSAQLLLTVVDPAGFGAFVLASVLVSLAVVPVSLTSVSAPSVPDPIPLSLRELHATAPLAMAGAVAAGFIGGAVVGAGAVYASAAGLSPEGTAVLIAGSLAAALVIQLPLGRASDRGDRRWVIAGVAAAGSLAALAAAGIDAARFPLLLACTSIAGGLSYPLYSLSNAHLNDYLPGGAVAAAGARMVLVNGAGAIAGPVVSTSAVGVGGAGGFFVTVAACYAGTAIYALYRLGVRRPPPEGERSAFVAMAPGTATTVATLAPHAPAELYPVLAGEIDTGVRLRWWERGEGPAVVIVHDAGASSDSWEGVALGLAATGYRVLAWDLRGHGDSGPAPSYVLSEHVHDLSTVLRHRGIARTHLVGHGAGGGIAAAFAAGRPEAVRSVVLVSTGDTVPRRPAVRAVERAVSGARRAMGGAREDAPGPAIQHRPPAHREVLSRDHERVRREAVAGTRRSVRKAWSGRDPGDVCCPSLRVRGALVGPSPGQDDVVFDATGHFVHLERPEALADVIVRFLHTVEARPAASAAE